MRGDDDEREQDGGQNHANGERAHHFARRGFFAHQMPKPQQQVDNDEANKQYGDDSQHGGIVPQTGARMKFRLRPLLALWTAAAVLATGTLAAWQFERAAQKRDLESAASAGLRAAPVVLAENDSPRKFQRAIVGGRFLPEQTALIDNRIRARRPGYDVVSPLLLDDGKIVAVNRGWIPARLDRAIPEAPPLSAERTTVRGVFVSDQSDALELGEAAAGRVLQNLKTTEYAARFGMTLRTTLALALEYDDDAALEGEMLPPTVTADFRSARSVAYAWQWLTFGFLALVFFVLLSRDSNGSANAGGRRRGSGKARGRVRNAPLILIVAIGVGAPVLSTAMYFFWSPEARTHYGELLSPPVAVPSDWREVEGAPPDWGGKWVLIRAGGSACGGECLRALCRMRQLRLMMHGDYHRVARAWLLTDDGAPEGGLFATTDCGETRAAELREFAAEENVLEGVDLLRGGAEVLSAGWLYLADPNGLLVMRYPPDADLYKIRKDFRRLLKLSRLRGAGG